MNPYEAWLRRWLHVHKAQSVTLETAGVVVKYMTPVEHCRCGATRNAERGRSLEFPLGGPWATPRSGPAGCR